jgi:hypothetical protein
LTDPILDRVVCGGAEAKERVLSQTTVYTDGWLAYDGALLSGYKHRRIHYHENEFARAKTLPTASRVFGATPSSASSSCAAFVGNSSFFNSRSQSGAGIIERIASTFFYSKTSASNRSNLGKTLRFFAAEVYERLIAEFDLSPMKKLPSNLRRNAVLSGVELNDWIGTTFEVDGVRFQGTGECSPCHWMNDAVCPGAERWLKGRGGLRAKILTDGILKVR